MTPHVIQHPQQQIFLCEIHQCYEIVTNITKYFLHYKTRKWCHFVLIIHADKDQPALNDADAKNIDLD